MNDAQKIQQWLDENRITEVECLIPDMTGLARGKIVPRHKYNPAEGLRLPEAVLSMTVTGDFPEQDFTSVADPDMRLIPDASTVRPAFFAIASMVVFIMAGEAYTWKTAFDETYARFSPGKLLMADLTEWHLDDANIVRTDSCAVPDHPIMSRFWKEREAMGTLVIGLKPNADRDVRQVGAQLHMYRNTRNIARILRDKVLNRRFGG